MKDLQALQAAIASVESDPSLQPVKDANGNILETHCNFGAERVADALGCHELDGLMADQQHAVMATNASGLWEKVDGQTATIFALSGGLAFASMSSVQLGEAHGHIATVAPQPMQFSGSLNKNVPVVANIGMTDQLEKDSMAFPVAKGEPDYFTWNG